MPPTPADAASIPLGTLDARQAAPAIDPPADTDTADDAATGRRLFFAVFPSIMLPMFLAALDQTIVATALPRIAADLGEVERVSWVVVSYLVATTIAAPAYGRLGDALGRKRLLFAALAVFVVASILCAVAPGIPTLTAARILQGFGGGGLMTLSQALVGEAVPPRQRGRYQGYLAAIFMCSSTFGPVAGGWLTQHFGWRSVFLINLPLGILAILLAIRLPRREGAPAHGRFDTLGLALFAAFVTALLIALERAQRFDVAAIAPVAAPLAVAATALFLLLRQERRAAQPLLPLPLLRQPSIWRSNALGAAIGATLVSLVTFVPIWMQVVRGSPPERTGLIMLPLTAFIAVGALCTGRAIAKSGRTAVFPSYGLVGVVITLVLLAIGSAGIPALLLPVVFAVNSLMMGTAMPVVQVTVQTVAGPRMLGSAAASVQLSRSIGAALGTALVGAVLFASLSTMDAGTAHLFAAMVERGPVVLQQLAPERLPIVRAEVATAFRLAFLTIAAFAAIGLGLAWSIPMRRFDQP